MSEFHIDDVLYSSADNSIAIIASAVYVDGTVQWYLIDRNDGEFGMVNVFAIRKYYIKIGEL